jgi:hypothetical protein
LKDAFDNHEDPMPKEGRKPKENVASLRQVELLVSQDSSIADTVRADGVTR